MSGESRRRRTPWRDLIEAVTVAIIMAVVLKYFIVEAYKIPTGSMQPTLMGNDRMGIYDRILVDKLSFHFRDPRRFEVVVFKFPLDRSKNFVKRLAGVGPEELRIAHGDLWRRDDRHSAWEIPRRSEGVLREMLKPLDRGPAPEDRGSRWSPSSEGAEGWTREGRRIAARGEGRIRFEHERHGPTSIRDRYVDGYPPGMAAELELDGYGASGQNPVGDLRVEGEVRALAGLQSIAIELTEGLDRRYLFELPGPAHPDGEGARPRIRVAGLPAGGGSAAAERVAEAPSPALLPVDRPVRFRAENIDDRLSLVIDGRPACELEVPPAWQQQSTASLVVRGEGADLDELQVSRDVYYTLAGGPSQVWVPAGQYFMLGDNTQDSSDSREWMFTRVEWREAGSEEGITRRGYRNHENPGLPVETPLGRVRLFRDEWGERWSVPEDLRSTPSVPSGRAPLVPRHLITGRAVLVFWPVPGEDGTHRLRWIR